MDTSGIDMNDQANLRLYSQLLVFHTDLSKPALLFENPESSQQRTLHAFAHGLGLEYEYSRTTRVVTITRSNSPNAVGPEVDHNMRHDSSTPLSTVHEPAASIWPRSHIASPRLYSMFDVSNWFIGENLLDSISPLTSMTSAATQDSHFVNGHTTHAGPTPSELATDISQIPSGESTIPASYFLNQSSTVDGEYQIWNSGDNGFIPSHVSEDATPILAPQTEPTSHSDCRFNQSQTTELTSSHLEGNDFLVSLMEGQMDPLRDTAQQRTKSSCRETPNTKVALPPVIPPIPSTSPMRNFSQSPGPTIPFGSERRSPVVTPRHAPPSPAHSFASSGSGGRRGRLNSIVVTTMKAVKAVGACWRCRILRKSCSPDRPCMMCPKREQDSAWRAVGCRTGSLKSEMPSLNMCTFIDLWKPDSAHGPEVDPRTLQANQTLERGIHKREEILKSEDPLSKVAPVLDSLLARLELQYPSLQGLRALGGEGIIVSPSSVTTYDECILAIIWEILSGPEAKSLFSHNLEDTILLFRSAALYAAETAETAETSEMETSSAADQLIAQSFICLRTALEALQVKAVGHLNRDAHMQCTSSCKIKCTTNITLYLDQYLDELSRILFLRESMLNSCWLSIFYSLCIHSYTRHIIITLAKAHTIDDLDMKRFRGFEEYLHLAVRLFIAVSGSYEPLVDDNTTNVGTLMQRRHYRIAKEAVKQDLWKHEGVLTTRQYLLRLFGDTGAELEMGSDKRLSAIDSMSIDDFPYPQIGIGGFQCSFPSCTTQPFQTQYLLNCHAKVHSSNRPHYCPVKGCPRSEGGKGFKRKSEMIRHGLAHDSPGYVCPFCPDREHKYPRPDNLQRHVRVRHVDKVSDPIFRDVLAAQPEPSSRSRRRRGGTS